MIFHGFVDERGVCTLDFPEAYRAYVATHLRNCEVSVDVTDRNSTKTRAQEAGFHAMITPWAKDRGWQIEDLKRYLLGRTFGFGEKKSVLTGEHILVQPSTSKLSKRQYSDLIEQAMIAAAEDGCVLMAPDEYRAMHPKKYPVTRTQKIA